VTKRFFLKINASHEFAMKYQEDEKKGVKS